MIRIDLPWTKPPLTGNRVRGNPHARANEVKTAKEQACEAILESYCWAVVGADVTLHFRPSTRQSRDADGLFPTLKVAQDALVILGVLPDDSWVHVPSATCRIHPPNGQPAEMWIELTDIHEFQESA